MENSNAYYLFEQFNESASFELPQYASPASTPCSLPKKPRQQQPKAKRNVQRLQYPDDISGPINFDFLVNVGDTPSACIYSKKLKKIYILINQVLRIKFRWSPTFQPLYLRSAIIYAEEHHKPTPVQRCYVHMGPELPQNAEVGYEELRYVFRVSDPANMYQSNHETDVNGILTTKTLLRAENGSAWIDYEFFCQNSCPTGINRRATKLIFLIEDTIGVIIAKKSVLIQICSNPKRDKERDECRLSLESVKKPRIKKQSQNQSPLPPLPPNNSQNTCNDQETVFSHRLNICGKENYKAVLKRAYDSMASDAMRTGNFKLYKPHMDAVLAMERELED